MLSPTFLVIWGPVVAHEAAKLRPGGVVVAEIACMGYLPNTLRDVVVIDVVLDVVML
jgi:hypothetical protein